MSHSDLADDIRALGWSVAVHNDYRLGGVPHTFWLFTKDGRAVKGEGRTDTEALHQVYAAIAAEQPPVWDGKGLPSVGSDVLIRHGRDDDDHVCTVTGYEVWPSLDSNPFNRRVLVHVVYRGTATKNARHLCELWPVGADTSAPPTVEAAPAEVAPTQEPQPCPFCGRGAWERRQATGDGRGGLNWGNWSACTEAEAKRVTGLRTWQVRQINYAHGGQQP